MAGAFGASWLINYVMSVLLMCHAVTILKAIIQILVGNTQQFAPYIP